MLGLGGGVLAWTWGGRDADQASVEDALDRFRRAESEGDGSPLRPDPGVYVYRGDGSERLSVLGASQHWGTRVPATVSTDGGDCWRIRIEYSTHHRQELDYCVDGTHLEEHGGRTEQRFDFGAFAVDDVSVFTCRPPGVALKVEAEPGDHWRQSCSGGSTGQQTEVTSAGTNRFLGRRRLTIGGTSVEAVVYRQDRTLTGDQTGVERSEIWFALDSGLPLRYSRQTEVESPSPLGPVSYTERGTITLLSLAARR